MVIPAGFEPATISLEGWCSIQLSYGTVVQQLRALFAASARVSQVLYQKN
jgi:hypothetical protein